MMDGIILKKKKKNKNEAQDERRIVMNDECLQFEIRMRTKTEQKENEK